MSQDRNNRPLTPPTQVSRLHSGLKHTTLRGYRSAEALRDPESASTLSKSRSSEFRGSFYPLPLTLKRKPTRMFPTLFSYVESSYQYQGEDNMEAGDFDNTPAPSARPSMALLRPEEQVIDASNPSSSPQNPAYRHHLLKTSTSGPMLVDKNAPIPPILSTKRTEPNVTSPTESWGTKMESENQDTSLNRKLPPVSDTSSPLGPMHHGSKVTHLLEQTPEEPVNTFKPRRESA